MTTGVTFYDWGGKPALIKDSEARAVLSRSGAWIGAAPDDGLSVAAIRSAGLSIGRDEFSARFSAWGLADLEGWFQARTLSWRDIRRS